MNLGQASKHCEFLIEESSKFFNGFKSGDWIDLFHRIKDLFFDLTFMIVFGELDYSKLDKVTYENPNSNHPPTLIDMKESILNLMGDGFE